MSARTRTRTIRRTTVAALTAGAVALLAGPAAGNTSSDTETTFEVTSSGDLTISAPSEADLGSAAAGETLSEGLGDITVTDVRSQLVRSWSVYVSSTDFTADIDGEDDPFVIEPDQLSYDPDALGSFLGGALSLGLSAGSVETLGSEEPVMTFSSTLATGLLRGSTSWNPEISLDPELAVPEGTYTGTITHSVVQ